MLTIPQSTAGWMLILLSIGICAGAAVLRTHVRRNPQGWPVRRILVRLRRNPLLRRIFGEIDDDLSAEDVDAITLIPGLYAALAIFLCGAALVVMDSFGIYLRLFTLET